MKKLTLLTILAVSFIQLFAQQDPEYTMYRFNGLFVNPGYAGSREAISATAISRYQWIKVPGAPRTASVGIHSPLKNNNIALGLLYTYDRITQFKSHDINAFFAYRIPVGKKKQVKISIGIQAGVKNIASDLQGVDLNDPDPNFVNSSLWLPNVGVGVYVYSPRFFVGLSVPHILANSLNKVKSNSIYKLDENIAHQYYHLVGTAGYVFNLGKVVKFAPSILMKYVPKYAPIDFDFNANFIFIDRIWIGAGYRLNDSYNFMAAVNVTRQFRVGYAYDLTVTPISKFTSGTHEVMLGYDFDFMNKRIVNPRYVKYF